MGNNLFECETCAKACERLYQSYQTGREECGTCALEDPFMSAAQVQSIERRQMRAAQARKNFKIEAAA